MANEQYPEIELHDGTSDRLVSIDYQHQDEIVAGETITGAGSATKSPNESGVTLGTPSVSGTKVQFTVSISSPTEKRIVITNNPTLSGGATIVEKIILRIP